MSNLRDPSHLIHYLANECGRFVQSMINLYQPKPQTEEVLLFDNNDIAKKTYKRNKQAKEIEVTSLESGNGHFEDEAFNKFYKALLPRANQLFPQLNAWETRRLIEREWKLTPPEERGKYSK